MCDQVFGPGPSTTKVLWFGDSEVLGTNTPNRQGMRRPLWDYHLSVGFRPELIGTQTSDPGGLTHTKHDGHAGREMEWLRDNVITPSFGAGKAIPYADLIFIHMATNNMGVPDRPPYDPVLTPELYFDLLEMLHVCFPNARICPATVGPFDRTTLATVDDNAIDFNATLTAEVIPDFELAYPGIIIPGWDANMCLNGGVWSAGNFGADPAHPNATGCAAQVETASIGLIAALAAA